VTKPLADGWVQDEDSQLVVTLEPAASMSTVATDVANRRQRRDEALRASILSGAGAKLLMTLFSLGSVAISVRAIGANQFGVLATLSTLVGLMAFADFGIGSGLMTFLAIADGREDPERARAMVSTACYATVGLGAAVAACGVIAAFTLPWSALLGASNVAQPELRGAVITFFVFVGLAIPAGLGQRTLVGHQEGLHANIWLLGATGASLCGILVAAVSSAPLWCFVFATMGLPVLVAFVQTVYIFRRKFAHLRPSLEFVTKDSFRSLAGVSSLFFGLNIAVALAYQSDAVIVASTLGAGAAAVFAVALRMFTLINGTLTSASQQMWASMAEALARGDVDWVRSRLVRIMVGTALVSIPASTFVVVAGRPIIRLWVGPDLVPPFSLLIALAVWTVYALAMTQISLLLNAAQVVGPQLVLALLMTIANLALSLTLTKRIGLSGPVVGSLVAHVVFTGVPSAVLAIKSLRRAQDPVTVAPKTAGWRMSE
jgi:O-antigen/teichoic acid export membrane protein